MKREKVVGGRRWQDESSSPDELLPQVIVQGHTTISQLFPVFSFISSLALAFSYSVPCSLFR